MRKYKFTIRGNEYNVDILNYESGVAEIEVNGTNYKVEIHQKQVSQSKTPKLVRSVVPPPSRRDTKIPKNISKKATAITAPLPGTIISTHVNVGDTIKRGDKILIMEAMKMENNVLAEKDGTIISLKVKAGDTVLQNDVLAEIE